MLIRRKKTPREKLIHVSSIALAIATLVIGGYFFITQALPILTAKPVIVTPSTVFLPEPTELKLATTLYGDIRYTLDGTEPSALSQLYTNPIRITQPTLIRMAVFDGTKQKTDTQDHFVLLENYHTVPIVSLRMESNPSWDDKYYEGAEANSSWEAKGEIEFYDDNARKFKQNVAIQLFGESLLDHPQKSLRLELVDEVGREQEIEYPLFGAEPPTSFSSLVLRNDDAPYSRLREQVANQFVNDSTGIDTLRGFPVVAYINGRYWGVYFLRERFDEKYLSEKYQVRKKTIRIAEITLGGAQKGRVVGRNKKDEPDAVLFNALLDGIARCNTCTSYKKANQVADMDMAIDYLFFQLYLANNDWPYNNYKIWRHQTDESDPSTQNAAILDDRFRWVFFDSDASFAAGTSSPEKMLEVVQGDPYQQLIDNAFPLKNMFFDEKFEAEYFARVDAQLQYHLTPEHTDAVVDHWAAKIRPEMPAQIERWKRYNSADKKVSVSSMEEWENEVEMLKLFLRERNAAFLDKTIEFVHSSDF